MVLFEHMCDSLWLLPWLGLGLGLGLDPSPNPNQVRLPVAAARDVGAQQHVRGVRTRRALQHGSQRPLGSAPLVAPPWQRPLAAPSSQRPLGSALLG